MSDEVSREELKTQALLQQRSEQLAQQEDRIAELRVDYTMVVNAYQASQKENEELTKRVQELEKEAEGAGTTDVPERDSDSD